MYYETPGMPLISTIIYLVLLFVAVIIAILGSILLTTAFTRDIKEVRQILKKKNVGIALVLASFIWTIGNMCFETIRPSMNAWYSAYSAGLSLNQAVILTGSILGSLLVALIFGAVTIFLAIKLITTITRAAKGIKVWEEINRGNTAAAVVLSVTVVVAGMFFKTIISSIVVNIFY